MATAAELQTRLAAYEAAELAILSGAAEYQVGTRRLKRADLKFIAEQIDLLGRRIAAKSSGPAVNHVRIRRS